MRKEIEKLGETNQKPEHQVYSANYFGCTGGPQLVRFQLLSAIPGVVQIENSTKYLHTDDTVYKLVSKYLQCMYW